MNGLRREVSKWNTWRNICWHTRSRPAHLNRIFHKTDKRILKKWVNYLQNADRYRLSQWILLWCYVYALNFSALYFYYCCDYERRKWSKRKDKPTFVYVVWIHSVALLKWSFVVRLYSSMVYACCSFSFISMLLFLAYVVQSLFGRIDLLAII